MTRWRLKQVDSAWIKVQHWPQLAGDLFVYVLLDRLTPNHTATSIQYRTTFDTKIPEESLNESGFFFFFLYLHIWCTKNNLHPFWLIQTKKKQQQQHDYFLFLFLLLCNYIYYGYKECQFDFGLVQLVFVLFFLLHSLRVKHIMFDSVSSRP